MKKSYLLPILVLTFFFAAAMFLIKDYGASADEHIQIESGHVIWRFLCQKFNFDVPEPIKNAPDLHGFKNSYYGQAATFPTVILEAVRGFSIDSGTVIKIRHYWNFFCYFLGLCCLAAVISHNTKSHAWSALWILFQILLPRIFGDIFYNDRDVMLISWMMIFISAFYLFSIRPCISTTFLMAIACGFVVNTRIFGLAVLIFPFLYFLLFPEKRKYAVFFLLTVLLTWYVLSPIAWDDPVQTLFNAFRHFSTRQRALDTGNRAKLLFFGKYINETKLPWYYIPAYLFVTTPSATLLFSAAGIFSFGKDMILRRKDIRFILNTGMLIILTAVPLIGIFFRLTFYNGWRHFYFLLLPVTWLSKEGVMLLWNCRKNIIRAILIILLGVSFILSAKWIIDVHPYQSIYINPFFRSRWIGRFDRDYWLLSTTESIDYLLRNASAADINVVDKSSFIEYTIIGFRPEERRRFHTIHNSVQPIPYEYLMFNYSNEIGNEINFDYYEPIYAVERDGIKLTEIYQRSHNWELSGPEIIDKVLSSNNQTEAAFCTDNNYDSAWTAGVPSELIFHFNRQVLLTGFEIFPADKSGGFRNVHVYISENGDDWIPWKSQTKGRNGTSFQPVNTYSLKLESPAKKPGIREILFYGQ